MIKKSNKDQNKDLAINTQKEMLQILSDLDFRMQMASSLGKTFGGKRDLYQDLGYKKTPTFSDYLDLYKRQDIAKAIINVPVKACWRHPPQIVESADQDTEFEKAWEDIVKKKNIWSYFSRIDRLASIGQYAVLFLGFDDGGDFSQEVKSAGQLIYLMSYTEQNAKIIQAETDSKNERYGQPKTYSLSMKAVKSTGGTFNRDVHWSRVIHVTAEDLLEDNNLGLPVLESVINRLQDLEKVVGGSAEMFWQGALPGTVFSLDPNAKYDPEEQSFKELKHQIEKFKHRLQRYLRVQGVTVSNLEQQIADPASQVSVIIDLLAAATRIPKRILLGSERGELASSQDLDSWIDRVDERRTDHCETIIIRPLIDRLIKLKVLPEPKENYVCKWPDLRAPGKKEQVEIGEIRSRSLLNYTNAIGADQIIPVDNFMENMLAYETQEIKKIMDRQSIPEGEAE